MATITEVLGTNTPNEGRGIWNTNFTNVNAELIANTAAIAGIGGTAVGTTQVQTLTNKTLVSEYLSPGTGNYVTVSRRDLNPGNTLFNVLSDSGSVTNIDVSQLSIYNLSILGGNGISTTVTSNVLYVKNEAEMYLNEVNQVFGVRTDSVMTGNVAHFHGPAYVRTFLAVGTEHEVSGLAEVHLKSTSPELRIETTTGTDAALTYRYGANQFVLEGDLTVPQLSLAYNATPIINFTTALTSLSSSLYASGATNTFTGNVNITGTLTAGGLVATATDVIINNGPVTISGGTSYIADGAIEHDKLSTITAGNIIIGNSSNIPTSTTISGDVTMTSAGVVTVGNEKITLAKILRQNDNTILAGNGTAVAALTSDGNGDVTFARNGTSLTFSIKTGSIVDADINEFAAIDIEKTTLTVSSGITYAGGEIGLTHPVSAVNPVGTIIAYAGNATGLAPTGVIEVIPGWLYCNGATVNSGAYPALYAVLGSAWGGSGQLPNLMGAFLRGVDPSGAVDPDTGTRTGGNAADIGSYQADTFESHTHTVGNYSTGQPPGGYIVTGAGQSSVVTTSATGGSETRPLNYGVAYLIKY